MGGKIDCIKSVKDGSVTEVIKSNIIYKNSNEYILNEILLNENDNNKILEDIGLNKYIKVNTKITNSEVSTNDKTVNNKTKYNNPESDYLSDNNEEKNNLKKSNKFVRFAATNQVYEDNNLEENSLSLICTYSEEENDIVNLIKKGVYNEKNNSNQLSIQNTIKNSESSTQLLKSKTLTKLSFVEGTIKFIYNIQYDSINKLDSTSYKEMFLKIGHDKISIVPISKQYLLDSLVSRIESDFMFHIFQEINSEKDKINIELLKDDDCYYFNLKEVKILKKQSFFNLYQIFILGKRKELDENYIDKSNQTLSKTHTITSSNKMTKSTTKIKDSSNKLNKIANHKKNNSNINIQNSVESNKKMYLHVIATSDSSLINQVIAVLNGLI